MEIASVKIEKPEGLNAIIGQSHFIKTVEDIHEALVSTVPDIKFGLAFCEASGPCLIRSSGTDEPLRELAEKNAMSVAAGHFFIILLGNSFPINVIGSVKNVPEVCGIYCATANDLEVLTVEGSGGGRGIIGVIDGSAPKGIESEDDIKQRKDFLRKIGYKS